MDDEIKRNLLAAQGYCELGMYEDAQAELNALPPNAQQLAAVVEMRLVVHMQASQWQPALTRAQELCVLRPEAPSGFIHAAFCLHELGQTAQAKETLLNGPESLQAEANYFYNLACYECRLGNLDDARQLLAKSITMDGKYRSYAKTDPDLADLQPVAKVRVK